MTSGAISRAKLQSNRHRQQSQHPAFVQAGCPSCRPTNSVKALKGKMSHSMDLLTPNSPGGLPTASLTSNSCWLPWLKVVMPLISRRMPVPQLIRPCIGTYFRRGVTLSSWSRHGVSVQIKPIKLRFCNIKN